MRRSPKRFEGSRLQIAEALDISPVTLRKLIRRGALPELGTLDEYTRAYSAWLRYQILTKYVPADVLPGVLDGPIFGQSSGDPEDDSADRSSS